MVGCDTHYYNLFVLWTSHYDTTTSIYILKQAKLYIMWIAYGCQKNIRSTTESFHFPILLILFGNMLHPFPKL